MKLTNLLNVAKITTIFLLLILSFAGITYGEVQTKNLLHAYWTNWARYERGYPPKLIPFDHITTVIYGFANIGNCGSPYQSCESGCSDDKCLPGSYATGTQDWGVYSTDPWSDLNPIPSPTYKTPKGSNLGLGGYAKVIKEAHKNNKLALISVGGYTLRWPLRQAITHHQTAFINSFGPFLNMVHKQTGETDIFDGVDIDYEPHGNHWEDCTKQELAQFAAFLKNLRSFLNNYYKQFKKTPTITIAAPAAPGAVKVINGTNTCADCSSGGTGINYWPQIIKAVDYIQIMAYDYHGAFDSPKITNYLAPVVYDPAQPQDVTHRAVWNVKSTIEAYLQVAKVPPQKLIVGFPAYGRAMYGVPKPPTNPAGAYQKFIGAPEPEWLGSCSGPITGVVDYRYIIGCMNHVENAIVHTNKTPGGKVVGTYSWNNNNKGDDPGVFVGFDDVYAVKELATIVSDNQIAGMMVWTLSGDIDPGDASNRSLIDVANTIMSGKPLKQLGTYTLKERETPSSSGKLHPVAPYPGINNAKNKGCSVNPVVPKHETSRCGKSWKDANNKCGQNCEADPKSCSDGETCYPNLTLCACKKKSTKHSSTRCGSDWVDASKHCYSNCSSKADCKDQGGGCYNQLPMGPCSPPGSCKSYSLPNLTGCWNRANKLCNDGNNWETVLFQDSDCTKPATKNSCFDKSGYYKCK